MRMQIVPARSYYPRICKYMKLNQYFRCIIVMFFWIVSASGAHSMMSLSLNSN
jgi:hypothetical protein